MEILHQIVTIESSVNSSGVHNSITARHRVWQQQEQHCSATMYQKLSGAVLN